MRGSLTPPSSRFPGPSVAAGTPFTTRVDPRTLGLSLSAAVHLCWTTALPVPRFC